jgi:MFS family permease
MTEKSTQGRIRYLIILSVAGFVTSFGAHIVATNLPSYAELVGAGAFMIGLLIAVYDFAELFAKPFAGYTADRRGMKLTLLVGLVVFILGSLLFLMIPPRFLLLVRFIQGLGAAALSTVSITLVAKYFTAGRGRAFGIYNAVKGAGYVIAPALGGFLVRAAGFSMVFIVSAAVGALALVLASFLPSDSREGEKLDDDDDMGFKEFLLIFRDPKLLPVYAVIVVNMFLVGILFGFLTVYLHGLGYTSFHSGIVVSVATGAYLLVQPLAGHLADRMPIRQTVLAGLFLAALAVATITFTSGLPLILVVIVAGLGVGTVWTNSDALVSSMAKTSQLGASIGAAQSFKEFGDMVGPLLIGFVTQFFGVRVGFVGCGALALIFVGLFSKSGRIGNVGAV